MQESQNCMHKCSPTSQSMRTFKPFGGADRRLVFGASGYIGTHLVSELAKRGYWVRAAARRLEVLEARNWHDVEVVAADVLDPDSLPAALDGITTAYYLVHSMAAGGDFRRLDHQAANNFCQAAERAGVKRIVYLGGLLPVRTDSEHLLSRQQTGERLRAGKVPVTEIRAGIIVGPGSAAFEVIRDLVNNLPVMVTPSWVRSKSTPIALGNLIEYLIKVPELGSVTEGVFDVAGPEILSYEEMMRQFAEVVGKKLFTIPVPFVSPTLSSYWLSLITSVPSNIASALIEGARQDILARNSELSGLIPQRLLNFKEAVQAALDIERRNAVAARWTEGALIFRDYRPDYAYYAKKAGGSIVSSASPHALWRQITAIGGNNRYYYLDFLWTIRESVDWLLGGPGLNRGRRHPTEVRLGDTIDFWKVVALQESKQLTLLMGLKAPGSGVLEFALNPEADGRTRLTVTAYWHPAGVWGLLYWYAMTPAHLLIFEGLAREIADRAEREEDKTRSRSVCRSSAL